MTIDSRIQALLDELHPVYNEVQQKRAQWERLQTVSHARAEYERLMAQEEEKLTHLKKRKKELEEEKRMLMLAPELDEEPIEPGRGYPPVQWYTPQVRPSVQPSVEANQSAKLIERRQLKKFVNRWKYAWQLNPTMLGQVNRIIDDADRPLGEALALLDWLAFADRTRTQESPQIHLARLSKWSPALTEYRDWLKDQIDILETRFRGWLPIWEIWRTRDQSAQGQEKWMTFIAKSSSARQDEIARLEGEISLLTEEVTQLKKDLQDIGGHHEQ